MPESERRIQRIAVGFAVVAMLVAALAVVIVATRHGAASPASRRVQASDLAKLGPETVQHAGDGLRVVDDALGKSLGLAREDTIVAISGRPVTRPSELRAALQDLEAFRPSSLFVDLLRDREPVLERWELDGDLEAARRAEAGPTHSAPSGSSDPLIATVNRIDSTTYELPRSTIEAWTADPGKLTAGIISARHLDDPDGFQILTVQPGSIVAALGVEDGDVIRGLNGIEITSIDKVLPIIAKSTTRISVDVRRHGQTIILNYLIK
jgi:S1-C subfamily serine protease